MHQHYDVLVVGAGIAGVAAAHALVEAGAGRIGLIESDAPLGLTSDKSTECYRNFWPGPDNAMATFMDDSITRLMAFANRSHDRFQMRQRGYLFATARPDEVDALAEQAAQVERYGGGGLRHHTGDSATNTYPPSPMAGVDPTLDGSDLITDQAMIRRLFPYLSDDTVGVLHVRKCGALSAQQLGMWLLEEARAGGAELIRGSVTNFDTAGGRLSGVTVATRSGEVYLHSTSAVLAPGPHLKAVAARAGADLPVSLEKHIKISISDRLGIVARDAPLIIWNDPIDLAWDADEREALAATPETRRLTEPFPAGVHGRPVGAGDQVLMYWTYDNESLNEPVFPVEGDAYLPEITLRGMATMVPGLRRYFEPMPKPYVDGGYYTKTADNRPLIGPLTGSGLFVCSAFSGYGIMAAAGAGALIAAHVTGSRLPAFAAAFDPARFHDADYNARIAGLAGTAQL